MMSYLALPAPGVRLCQVCYLQAALSLVVVPSNLDPGSQILRTILESNSALTKYVRKSKHKAAQPCNVGLRENCILTPDIGVLGREVTESNAGGELGVMVSSVYLDEFPLQFAVFEDLLRRPETPLTELPVLTGPADQAHCLARLEVLCSLIKSSDLKTGDLAGGETHHQQDSQDGAHAGGRLLEG